MNKGWLTVIVGCMFSGKTGELIKLLRRLWYGKNVIQLFKPIIDTRYDENDVVSHDKDRWEAEPIAIDKPLTILELIKPDTTVVGIDEAQFFSADIVKVCEELTYRGINVIVAGLKQDRTGKLFGSMDKLLIMANFIENQVAVCVKCGDKATMTQWVGETPTESQIVVGGSREYAAVCHRCHIPC